MTRILIATIALAGIAGYAAAQEAPTFESTYTAKVETQSTEKKPDFRSFFGSRNMGGSVVVSQPIHDENYYGN